MSIDLQDKSNMSSFRHGYDSKIVGPKVKPRKTCVGSNHQVQNLPTLRLPYDETALAARRSYLLQASTEEPTDNSCGEKAEKRPKFVRLENPKYEMVSAAEIDADVESTRACLAANVKALRQRLVGSTVFDAHLMNKLKQAKRTRFKQNRVLLRSSKGRFRKIAMEGSVEGMYEEEDEDDDEDYEEEDDDFALMSPNSNIDTLTSKQLNRLQQQYLSDVRAQARLDGLEYDDEDMEPIEDQRTFEERCLDAAIRDESHAKSANIDGTLRWSPSRAEEVEEGKVELFLSYAECVFRRVRGPSVSRLHWLLHACDYDTTVATRLLKPHLPVQADGPAYDEADAFPGDDLCFICREGGNLIVCEEKRCSRVFHPACLKMDKLPGGSWLCPRHHCHTCKRSPTVHTPTPSTVATSALTEKTEEAEEGVVEDGEVKTEENDDEKETKNDEKDVKLEAEETKEDEVILHPCTTCCTTYCQLHIPSRLVEKAAQLCATEFMCSRCLDKDVQRINTKASVKQPKPDIGRLAFIDRLLSLLSQVGMPLRENPCVGKHELNLYQFYTQVTKLGGIAAVIRNNQMDLVRVALNLPVSSSYDVEGALTNVYLKVFYPYERRHFAASMPVLRTDLSDDFGRGASRMAIPGSGARRNRNTANYDDDGGDVIGDVDTSRRSTMTRAKPSASKPVEKGDKSRGRDETYDDEDEEPQRPARSASRAPAKDRKGKEAPKARSRSKAAEVDEEGDEEEEDADEPVKAVRPKKRPAAKSSRSRSKKAKPSRKKKAGDEEEGDDAADVDMDAEDDDGDTLVILSDDADVGVDADIVGTAVTDNTVEEHSTEVVLDDEVVADMVDEPVVPAPKVAVAPKAKSPRVKAEDKRSNARKQPVVDDVSVPVAVVTPSKPRRKQPATVTQATEDLPASSSTGSAASMGRKVVKPSPTSTLSRADRQRWREEKEEEDMLAAIQMSLDEEEERKSKAQPKDTQVDTTVEAVITAPATATDNADVVDTVAGAAMVDTDAPVSVSVLDTPDDIITLNDTPVESQPTSGEHSTEPVVESVVEADTEPLAGTHTETTTTDVGTTDAVEADTEPKVE